jgi:hypothetical protein
VAKSAATARRTAILAAAAMETMISPMRVCVEMEMDRWSVAGFAEEWRYI